MEDQRLERRGKWDVVASVLGELDGWPRVAAIAIIAAAAVVAYGFSSGALTL